MRTVIIVTGVLLATAGRVAAEDEQPATEDQKPATETATTEPGVSDADDPADAVEPQTSEIECKPAPVVFRRRGRPGESSLDLVTCAGEPNLEALQTLSALAQPLPASGSTEDASHDALLEPVRELDPGLLTRLQRIAAQFPGHAFEIVSGYRPHARPGSRHRSARALDLRVEDVDNRELSEFARTLEATGVGYYPNSSFVHVDVRDSQFYWVDRSGPGQRPRYGAEPAAKPVADETRAANTTEPKAEPSTADMPKDDAQVAQIAPPAASPAALEPELRALSDRALVVMAGTLDRKPYDRNLPARRED